MAKKSAPKKKAAKKASPKKSSVKKSSSKTVKKSAPKKWSKKVMQTSNAMDLEKDIFKSKDPKKIAASVKHSAEKSKRKKAGPFQSAMSMINFYENRGGKNLSAAQKKVLDKSKNELRKLYGREEE
ncbi:MAG TPA: DUF3175 domain-containing protein [Parafilimonas sp.]